MRLPPAKAFAGFLLLVAFLFPMLASSVCAKEMEHPFARRHKIPPLPQNLVWLNTAGPLELHSLRGKFVLLDFWTYCCINCMHILPELHKLEQAWPKNLVVIGVHSAKFTTEQDTANIRAAIQRYKIAHPVINDARHELWEFFGVRAWPTVLLIDPDGYAVWGTSGEITFEQVDKVIRAAMPYYRQKKSLDETPLRFDMERRTAASGPLSFPGKVLADASSDRLFIADSNHNRIVIAKLDGTLLDVIGNGQAGRQDGDFATARFNQPQGMALRDGELFVADTENHDIRRVDLARRKVATIAGTGRQAREPANPGRPADPGRTALNSPWDLWIHGDGLFVAMAGCHQIWRMSLDGSTIGPYAGNGREDIVDGPCLPRQPYQAGFASFAQPSGLAGDNQWLYVADSEGSSIRAVPLDSRQEVRTVVGTARLPYARLFTFGDVDGPAAKARFQHPLGVAFYDGRLYVADTYNHKIRVVDPADGATRTLAGTGKPGQSDEPAAFFEPAGLSVAGGKLFVADTNNHRIRTLDLKTSRVMTLAISGLKPPEPPAAPSVRIGDKAERLPLAAVRAEQGRVRLRVELELPPGHKLNALAPMEYLVEADDRPGDAAGPMDRAGFGRPIRIERPAAEFDILLPVKGDSGRDTIRVGLEYYYCREGAEGLCMAGSAAWLAPIELSASAEQAVVRLRHKVR